MDDNLSVWNKKEFIYKLDGKYYFLGLYACEECNDPHFIEMYDHFEDVCNCKQFEKDVRDIPDYYKQDVAKSFNPIANECRERFQTDKTDIAVWWGPHSVLLSLEQHPYCE